MSCTTCSSCTAAHGTFVAAHIFGILLAGYQFWIWIDCSGFRSPVQVEAGSQSMIQSSWRCSPPSQSGCDDALIESLKTGRKWHPGGSHPHSESAPFWICPVVNLPRCESAPLWICPVLNRPLNYWGPRSSSDHQLDSLVCLGPMCSPGCPQLSWGNVVCWGTFKPKTPLQLQCTMFVLWRL